ncbi:MAG: spore coat protein GerQ [Bacilli bacterium]|nr:spore coat protein GerQ [Bacilli bacterium]MDD4298695.1 spore coat protein GerQ [Bacilli bacterium]MDD4643990.1 spore coat protein GerQ [Bacilli bacterium]
MFPGGAMPSGTPNQQLAPSIEQSMTGMLPSEQSYIENILRLNKGKVAKFYMSFPDSVEWRDRVFHGIIEAAGRDHIIVSDPNTGLWHLLRIIYLDYVDFEEPINYSPIFSPAK